jgi:hypothetical protein
VREAKQEKNELVAREMPAGFAVMSSSSAAPAPFSIVPPGVHTGPMTPRMTCPAETAVFVSQSLVALPVVWPTSSGPVPSVACSQVVTPLFSRPALKPGQEQFVLSHPPPPPPDMPEHCHDVTAPSVACSQVVTPLFSGPALKPGQEQFEASHPSTSSPDMHENFHVVTAGLEQRIAVLEQAVADLSAMVRIQKALCNCACSSVH